MLGLFLSIIDTPMTIQNPGLFIACTAICLVGVTIVVSGCLAIIRTNIEELSILETVDMVERELRLADIMKRVEMDLAC